MKLLNIAATGIKGTAFNHELKGVTVVAGKNRTRKTAVLDAITLALFNFHPRYGVRGTAELGNDIRIILETTDGTTARNFRDGKALSKEPPLAPRVLLDASEFMVKTEAEREAMLFQRCDTSKLGFGHENITAAIKALKLEDHTPEDEEKVGLILKDTRELLEKATGEPLQTWLPKVIKRLREQATAFKAVAKQMAEKIKADAQLASSQGLGGSPINVSKLLAGARETLTNTEKEISTLEHQISTLQKAQQELDDIPDLEAQIKALEHDKKTYEDQILAYKSATPGLVAERDALQRDLDRVTKELEEATRAKGKRDQLAESLRDPANSTLEEEIKTLKLEHETLDIKQPFCDLVDKLDGQVAGKRQEYKRLDQEQKEKNAELMELQAAHDQDTQKECCPTCNVKSDQWQETVRNRFAQASQKLVVAIDKLTGAMKQAATEGIALAEQLKQAQAAREANEARLNRLQTIENRLSLLNHRREQLALDRATLEALPSVALEPLQKEVARLTGLVASYPKFLEKAQEQDAAQDSRARVLKNIKSTLADQVLKQQRRVTLLEVIKRNPELRGLEERKAKLNQEAGALREKVLTYSKQERELISHQSEQLSRERAKQQQAGAVRLAALYEQAGDVITGQQNNLTEMVIQSLLVRCHELTTGFFGSPLTFREGAFGYWDGRNWVGRKSLSGYEEALAMVGLQLALADETPVKLVMIDELGRLDRENRKKFLRHMVLLVETGKLDNFIATDNDWTFYCQEAEAINGLQVISTNS